MAPMIALFTDFGYAGPYVGQLHAVLAREAASVPVIDLMHDAPPFDPVSAAHLLDAVRAPLPAGTVCVGVIDPGVGTARDPVVLEADGNWFVGPGNGLFDVLAARAGTARCWRITRAPDGPAATFHGRDLFAPVAALLARGEAVPGEPVPVTAADHAGADRAAIVYIDGFGNAVTGLRPSAGRPGGYLVAAGRRLPPGRTFADVEPGEPLWYVNSMGLVEVAVRCGNAAAELGLAIGSPVHWNGT